MIWWKQYTLSIIGCVALCGIVIHIVSDFRYKKIIRLVGGTLLAAAILNPLSSADFRDSLELDIGSFSPDEYVNSGKMAAAFEQEQRIRNDCESYIANKAKELGTVATAEIFLNEKLHPNSARLYIHSGSECQKNLEQILEEDLGITKENQLWIWSQEERSS